LSPTGRKPLGSINAVAAALASDTTRLDFHLRVLRFSGFGGNKDHLSWVEKLTARLRANNSQRFLSRPIMSR
jgi:hypothetical protein